MANTNTAVPAPARRKKRDTRQLWAFGFCLPNILFFLVFFVAPAIGGVWNSVFDYNGFKQMDFVGLSNYMKLFRDPEFYKTLWQTILYSIVSVPLGYAVALGLGLLLSSEKIKGITILRILIYWPILLSTIMVGLTWRWIFGESFGLINYLLQCIGLDGIKWATNPTAAFITTIIAGIWSGCGTNMLIFIGALKQVPGELLEAANLDGANKWQRFLRITLPCLSPIILYNLVMQTITAFMAFTQAFVITQGGPNDATNFYALYVYNHAFKWSNMGYASAMSWLMLVLISLITFILFKSSKFWVFSEADQ